MVLNKGNHLLVAHNETNMKNGFSAVTNKGCIPACTVLDTDSLIALYNASWRHIILTYISLRPSPSPPLNHALTSLIPAPLQCQWEVACSLSLRHLHIWSSPNPLCPDVATHATVTPKEQHRLWKTTDYSFKHKASLCLACKVDFLCCYASITRKGKACSTIVSHILLIINYLLHFLS